MTPQQMAELTRREAAKISTAYANIAHLVEIGEIKTEEDWARALNKAAMSDIGFQISQRNWVR